MLEGEARDVAAEGRRPRSRERKERQYRRRHHHMPVPWHEIAEGHEAVGTPAKDATTAEKASLVGRIGLVMLSCGTGAWRVRESMNHVARCLGVSLSADIGLTTIDVTVFDGAHHYTEALSLPEATINTDRLHAMEVFLDDFEDHAATFSASQLHKAIDRIAGRPANYRPLSLGLAAALACGAFCFLLGGDLVEVVCSFVGAFVGQLLRSLMGRRRMTLVAVVGLSVMAACATYVVCVKALELALGVPSAEEAGYICSLLFVIPGFPLITGGIDLAKEDLRSGVERLTYALVTIVVATCAGMLAAYLLRFEPAPFEDLGLDQTTLLLLRLLASFCGVYGFSYLYNSPRRMAATAAAFGMLANTLRLELVGLLGVPVGVAAYLGALAAGLMAGLVERATGYPRIALTVPSIVIMVPGLFMYQAVYYFAMSNPTDGMDALAKAVVIALALPLGLITARIVQDPNFRHNG